MDEKYIRRALELAQLGEGRVNPNPLVGAVIVKEGRIIGEGYHEFFGGPHAEINAFKNSKKLVEGATMYVTLEPCSHYGKTPPCAKAIIERNIKKVVIGTLDPNPEVSGRGEQLLKAHGIEVVKGVLEKECLEINEIFMKIIIDSSCKIPMEARILSIAYDAGTIIATTCRASKSKIRALEEDIVDKVQFFIAPKIIGGESAKTPVGGIGKEYMKDHFDVFDIGVKNFEGDILIEGYVRRKEG